MEDIYVLELHEGSRFESFVKFIGYTKDESIANTIETQYNEDEDCEYYVVVSKIKEIS